MKYEIGQEFLLNQDIEWETSTVNIEAKKNSKIEIIEIDESDAELPYKTFFYDANNWIFLSDDEIEEITKSAMAEY